MRTRELETTTHIKRPSFHNVISLWLALSTVFIVLPVLHAQASSQTTVDIEGSKNPELIPDRDAYWILFLQLSEGPGAFKWRDRVEFLKPSGLTEPQIDTVLRSANDYRAVSDAARAKTRAIKAANPERPMPPAVISALNSVAAEEASALDAAIQRLVSPLDPEARWKLKTFLDRRVKATMVLTKPR